MEKLVEIQHVKIRLKTATRSSVRILYQLVFEEKSDRKNRRKLREFSGFTFSYNIDEYRAKLEYAGRGRRSRPRVRG